MISIIIPTINEAVNINKLIPFIQKCCAGGTFEIIVADGGSSDNTQQATLTAGAIFICCPKKGRAAQMNAGAAIAIFDILYFIHADTLPPSSFYTDITKAVKDGYGIGRYRTAFSGKRWILKINAFFTRFDWFVCYGGDQTIFVTKAIFNAVNGYNEDLLIMEEYDFTARARINNRYRIFANTAIVSDRKYDTNSWWRVQRANYITVKKFKKGVPQKELLENYKQMLSGLR